MGLPIAIAIKNFFGIYELTPLEEDLLKALSDALTSQYQTVLKSQLGNFNAVRRLVKYVSGPHSHGFTNFHVIKRGKEVSQKVQLKRFPEEPKERIFATAKVLFDEGEIFAEFWLVRGIFFRIKYRSPQNIWYPPDGYRVADVHVLI